MSLMQDQIEALRQANAQREEEMRRPQTLRWELGTASTCKCEVGMIFDASAPVTITSHPYFYKRPWVSLTDEEIKEIVGPWGDTPIKGYTRKLFDQIEAKLREKNT